MSFPVDPRGLRYLPTTPICYQDLRAFALASDEIDASVLTNAETKEEDRIELRTAENHAHVITVIGLDNTVYSGFYVFQQDGMSMLSVIGEHFGCFFVVEDAEPKFTHLLNHQTGMGPAIETPQDTDEPFIDILDALDG